MKRCEGFRWKLEYVVDHFGAVFELFEFCVICEKFIEIVVIAQLYYI